MISSEALADPTLLNNIRPIKVVVDPRPTADAPIWHRYFFSMLDHQLEGYLSTFESNMIEGWYAVAWNTDTVYVLLKNKRFKLMRETHWVSDDYKKMQKYAEAHGVQTEYLDFNERFKHYAEIEDYKLTQHVAFSVNNMAESVAWYTDKLSAEVTHEYQNGDMEIVQIAIDDVRLELFHFSEMAELPSTARDLTKDLHAVGAKHLCIQTSHFEQTIDALKQKGVEFVMDVDDAAFGGKYIFFRDCNGILVELYGQ